MQVGAQSVDDSGVFTAIKAASNDTIIHGTMIFYDTDTDGNYDAAFTLSAGPIVAWGDYSVALAFYSSGFKVRNGAGGGFVAIHEIYPEPGEVVDVWIDVDVGNQTHSTWVQTSGMDYPALIFPDAAFRRTPVDSIAYWSALHNPAGEPDTLSVSLVEFAEFIPGMDVATLSALDLSMGALEPAFDPAVTEYDVLLPWGTTGDINVSASATTMDAVVSGAGAIDVTPGTARDTIMVVSSGGADTMRYYIDFTVDDGSTDAYLSDLSLDTSTIDPAFYMLTFDYVAYVPVGTTTVDITATKNYTGATVSGDLTANIQNGGDTAEIVVTAQDGTTTNTYTIIFIEADGKNYGMDLPGGNGNNSNVDVSGLPVTSWPMTVEFWIKPDGNQPNNTGLFYHRGTGDFGIQYSSGWQGAGKLRLMTNIGGNYGVLSPVVAPDVWHNVAMVVTDTSRTIYLDGIPYYERIDIAAYDWSAGNLYIGWDAGASDRAFKGLIDDVRVWSEYKDSADLADGRFDVLKGDEAGLVAYWNFDLMSPTVAVDLAGNGLHGTITGGQYAVAFDPADASLSALDVNIGALDPVFDPDVTSYEVIFPVGTASIDVSASPTNLNASVAGEGAVDVSSGSATADVVVTAQNGIDQMTYSISFVEADGKNYAISLPGETGSSSNIDVSGVGLNTLPYTIEMWIKPDGAQENNTGLFFNRPGNIGLEYCSGWQGGGKLRFMTSSGGDQYGSQSLTVIVAPDQWHHVAAVLTDSTRTVYLDGQPYTEEVAAGTFTPDDYASGKTYIGWDSDATQRTFKGIIEEVRVWSVAKDSATLADDKFNILNGDEADLVGYWNFDLTNEAQAVDLTGNGAHGLITGGVYVPSFDDADANLTGISLSKGGLDPVFDAATLSYSAVVPKGTDSVIVSAAASHPLATIDGEGTVKLTSGTGTANLLVTAPDGTTTQTYVVNFTEHDGSLTLMHSYTFEDGTAADAVGDADGVMNGGTIVEGVFTSSAEGDYITLPGEELSLYRYPAVTLEGFITAGDGTNGGYTMISYFGDLSGANSYWIQLTRPQDQSWTETRTGSASAATAIGPELDDGQLHHIVSVLTYDTLFWFIDGVPIDTAATGDNAVNGISTANAWLNKSGWPDPTWLGSIHEFNIYSGAMDADMVLAQTKTFLPLYDAALSALSLDVGDLVPDFDPETLDYTATVPFGTTSVTVTATARQDGATIAGADPVDVSSGSGTATIVVTAEDTETTKTYTVDITVEPGADNADLKNITVNPGVLDPPFNKDVITYSVLAPKGTTSVAVTWEADDANASVTGDATIDVSSLSGTGTITVTAENTTTVKTYTINVTVDATGIEEMDASFIEVFPTLARGSFTVRFAGEPGSITVYDISGRVLLKRIATSSEELIQITDEGVLYLNIESEGYTHRVKVFNLK
jgi:hypothetical protein